jgi:DNA gyrase subunit A
MVAAHSVLAWLEALKDVNSSSERGDFSVDDRNGVMSQRPVDRRDGEDPSGLDNQVGRLFRWHVARSALKLSPYVNIPLSTNARVQWLSFLEMSEVAREIIAVNLEDEMRQSYLDYAMSVIVGRALPDVRDGLKPVHRRVLYAMRELGNDYNKPYKKSARIVGDVIGKYHPHGDTAVYDTMVRMAQPFSMRYMLIDGQGNFGSVDGDAPAAMRYTEVRMSRIAHELLADIDKDTVDFNPNYDESETEPAVLPARVPNLLINGQTGIAVGMATNIPPHNLTEVINACLALLDDPSLPLAALMQHVPGPDFPTAGIINGAQEIATAYRTGRGRLSIRSRAHFEEIGKGERQAIVITELPYQVNKARLQERIADLVRAKDIEGISEIRDESDKDGMRLVIELKRGEIADVVLNNLYAQTPMETVFGMNMVALQDGQPKLLSLKEMLEAFIRHRREVVTRRTIHDLARARDRAHILEGLAIALANIDEVIALIKAAPSSLEARAALQGRAWSAGIVPQLLERAGTISTRPKGLAAEVGMNGGGYYLSEAQAQAILDMRLHRLTGLEQDKIIAEYKELLDRIRDLGDILARPERLTQVVREELIEVRAAYGDARRTEINRDHLDLSTEDLIEPQDVVVTLSHAGYAKSQPVTEYQTQRRGGRGKAATAVKDEDFVEKLFVANTHDTVLCFSNRGKVYWLKVHQLPQAGRGARGKPMVNLLPLEEGEKINALLPIKEFDEQHFVFMATSQGTVKKTPLSAFSRPRTTGIIAIGLEENDRLVGVGLTDGQREIVLVTSEGKAIRFPESDVRSMGREAGGVRGIKLGEGKELIALIVVGEGHILTASENGYGKRTPLEDFPLHGRGGQGVIALQTSDRNGATVAGLQVTPGQEIMLISSTGTLVRTPVDEISIVGRNTQGVRLIRLAEGERLTGIERVESFEGGDEGADEGAVEEAPPA